MEVFFSYADDNKDQEMIIKGIKSVTPYRDEHDLLIDIAAIRKFIGRDSFKGIESCDFDI